MYCTSSSVPFCKKKGNEMKSWVNTESKEPCAQNIIRRYSSLTSLSAIREATKRHHGLHQLLRYLLQGKKKKEDKFSKYHMKIALCSRIITQIGEIRKNRDVAFHSTTSSVYCCKIERKEKITWVNSVWKGLCSKNITQMKVRPKTLRDDQR